MRKHEEKNLKLDEKDSQTSPDLKLDDQLMIPFHIKVRKTRLG